MIRTPAVLATRRAMSAALAAAVVSLLAGVAAGVGLRLEAMGGDEALLRAQGPTRTTTPATTPTGATPASEPMPDTTAVPADPGAGAGGGDTGGGRGGGGTRGGGGGGGGGGGDTGGATDGRARNATARYAGQPLYTKLRLTLQSNVAWAAASLGGLRSVTSQGVSATPGLSVSALEDGIAVQGVGTGVIDVVFQLPERDVVARICKASGGTARLTVTRLTEGAEPAAVLDDAVNGDAVVDGCANRAATTVAAGALAPRGAWPAPIDDRRLVLAQYYPWWDPSSSFPFIEQPLAPYDTASPEGVGAIIDQARSAGVDGFLVSYQHVAPLAGRFELVVQQAAARGFWVAPHLEIEYLYHASNRRVDGGVLESWFRSVLASAGSPSFLEVGGRPVVFMFRGENIAPDVFQAVRARLRASGLDPFVVSDNPSTAWAFDGLYTYTPNIVPNSAALGSWYWHQALSARLDASRGLGASPILWAAPVSPGENDSYATSGSMGLLVDRAGGGRYDATWAAALTTRPEWVIVNSWNALPEATQVAPGTLYEHRALEQTAAWSSVFHTG